MPAPEYKTVCACCGAVMNVELPEVIQQENWLPCVLPTGFEWNLPAGRIVPIVGPAIYVDAMGEEMSKEEYLKKYNLDPEIAYTAMRGASPKEPVAVGKVTQAKMQPTKQQRKILQLGKGR